MKIITVSAACKDVGKTSLVVYLIRKLLPCAAVKFSIHEDNPYGEGILEEQGNLENSDTGRMKQAGANPVYWVKTDKAHLKARVSEVQKLIDKNMPSSLLPYEPKVIMEGNSILDYVKPDYSIFIMNNRFDDFKASAWNVITKTSTILINGETSLKIENKCRDLNKNGKIIFTENINIIENYCLIFQDCLKQLEN